MAKHDLCECRGGWYCIDVFSGPSPCQMQCVINVHRHPRSHSYCNHLSCALWNWSIPVSSQQQGLRTLPNRWLQMIDWKRMRRSFCRTLGNVCRVILWSRHAIGTLRRDHAQQMNDEAKWTCDRWSPKRLLLGMTFTCMNHSPQPIRACRKQWEPQGANIWRAISIWSLRNAFYRQRMIWIYDKRSMAVIFI